MRCSSRPYGLLVVFAASLCWGCGDANLERNLADTQTTDGADGADAGDLVDIAVDAIDASDSAGGVDALGDQGVDSTPDLTLDTVDAESDTAPPDPTALTPCQNGACWNTSVPSLPCREDVVNENYSSGNYNVHRYGAVLHPAVATRITLQRTAGSWAPALIVADRDGTVLSDGRTPRVAAGLEVVVTATGEAGDTADVSITSAEMLPVDVYVTGWTVVDSDFTAFLGQDARYTFTVSPACATPPVACVVNGHTVPATPCGWLNHIGRDVVPQMVGTRDERLDHASVVAWWSLKEGVLSLANPIVYSNCHFSTGDAHIGPLEVCVPGNAWQVGLSAVQVPWASTLQETEDLAVTLYPGMSSDEVLRTTAIQAGLSAADIDAVVASTGELRHSWLLRTSPIGFEVQFGPVTSECIDRSLSWCYGTGWTTTANYAPDKAAALRSIADIRALFDQLAP